MIDKITSLRGLGSFGLLFSLGLTTAFCLGWLSQGWSIFTIGAVFFVIRILAFMNAEDA